jgi:hypothetical protein
MPRQVSFAGLRFGHNRNPSDVDDTLRVMSYAPTLEPGGDMESMLGDPPQDRTTPGWKSLTPLSHKKRISEEQSLFPLDQEFEDAFEHEFDELDDITSDGLNEG